MNDRVISRTICRSTKLPVRETLHARTPIRDNTVIGQADLSASNQEHGTPLDDLAPALTAGRFHGNLFKSVSSKSRNCWKVSLGGSIFASHRERNYILQYSFSFLYFNFLYYIFFYYPLKKNYVCEKYLWIIKKVFTTWFPRVKKGVTDATTLSLYILNFL